mmetsp:Transcript_4419/g.10173  ORF Transcript_4419/g.10173 Transcript_4419/m.10173 type:complete len:146 (+) Transcript_4419:1210-1647(+)
MDGPRHTQAYVMTDRQFSSTQPLHPMHPYVSVIKLEAKGRHLFSSLLSIAMHQHVINAPTTQRNAPHPRQIQTHTHTNSQRTQHVSHLWVPAKSSTATYHSHTHTHSDQCGAPFSRQTDTPKIIRESTKHTADSLSPFSHSSSVF